jgi:hypothetical protein
MQPGEARKFGDSLIPAPHRFMGIDRIGCHDFARRIDDCDLDSGTEAWIKTHGGMGASRRCEQKVAQITGKNLDRFGFRKLPHAHAQIDTEMQFDLGAPSKTDRSEKPTVTRTAPIPYRELIGNARFVADGAGRRFRSQSKIENFLFLGPEHCQDTV